MLHVDKDNSVRLFVHRNTRWGPLAWSVEILNGPMTHGTWYAWTEDGAIHKGRRRAEAILEKQRWYASAREVKVHDA